MKNRERTIKARTETINIRASRWEKEVIKSNADRMGLSVSAYLLGLVFGFGDKNGMK